MSIAANFPAIKPSLLLDFANTKALDPRITFTRAATAVYYDGVTTAMAEQNLLTYSQEFDNAAWSLGNTATTANATTAPDGTLTADLFYPTSTGTYRTIRQAAVVAQAVSVFAKAELMSGLAIGFAATGSNYTYFDLSAGTVGTISASASSAAITSLGNDWYRCVVIFTGPQTDIRLAVVDANGSIVATASGTNGIYIWGAQLEQRSAVTAYTPTTTQQITNYVPVLLTAASGAARFDHNPTTFESLGLLIEEQRTNLLTYSEQFDNAAWTKSRVTVTVNTIVSPDGTLDADKLVETTDTGEHYLTQTPTVSANTVYTASIYVKAAEVTAFRLRIYSTPTSSNNVTADFSTLNSTPTVTVSGAATSFGATSTSVENGWFKIVFAFNVGGTDTQLLVRPTLLKPGNSYTGDGYSGLYIWGAQLEAGSFPTSYIPTVASQVTRAADAASMTGVNFSSWYAGGAGTMYSESAVYASNIKTQVVWDFSGGSTSTSLRSPQAATPNLRAAVGGTFSGFNTGAVISNNTFIKATVAWQGLSGRLQSGATGEDVTGAINLDATQLIVGGIVTPGANSLNGHIRKLSYYPIRVTNTQLQALTS